MTFRELLFFILGAQITISAYMFIWLIRYRPSKYLPPLKTTGVFHPDSDYEFIGCQWAGDTYAYTRAMEDLKRAMDENGIIRDEGTER